MDSGQVNLSLVYPVPEIAFFRKLRVRIEEYDYDTKTYSRIELKYLEGSSENLSCSLGNGRFVLQYDYSCLCRILSFTIVNGLLWYNMPKNFLWLMDLPFLYPATGVSIIE